MKAKIVDIKQETHDTKTFSFELERELEFKTGQFVVLTIPNFDISRPFSISCAGGKKKTIFITMKIYSDGKFTSKANRLVIGDFVHVIGPFGHFVLDPNLKKDIVLLGAGSGISSLRSMYKYVVDNNINNNIKIIYSVKTIRDIIFYDEMKLLVKQNKNFELFITLTDSKNNWDGNFGRLNSEILDREISNKDSVCFICGPPNFVNAMVEILEKIGVPKDNIKREIYN